MEHMMMMMPDHLMFRPDVTILFKGWKSKNSGEMAASCFALMVLAIMHEAVKCLRETLKNNEKPEMYEVLQKEQMYLLWSPNILRKKIFNLLHLTQTLLHMVQMTLSYMLMLAVMTYNAWLLIAILIGSAIGYFIFAHKKLQRQLVKIPSFPDAIRV
ncbi:high affinity copper uptake protein 1 isoform X1 [Hydra vulgaris]|uniref:high affinity copper uptake protein 1 isoform X1 n=1 Tax=Hydra vulgaris TaxID=6087 RepID=UPI001F5E4A07|nr:high affinity copper uptake protein 1-like [Hydra vulgaris]